MYALWWASWTHMLNGTYVVVHSLLDELATLADEKDGTLFWKATATVQRGCALALTSNPTDAVHMIVSGLAAYRSTGATLYEPWHLYHLAMAHAELGELDD